MSKPDAGKPDPGKPGLSKPGLSKTVLVRAIVLVLLVLSVAAFLIDWNMLIGPTDRRYTNDAMLQGNPTQLSARVGGYLTAVPVSDYSIVHAGDLLFAIEDTDQRARVDQASAQVDAARAGIAQSEAQLALQTARLAADTATIHAGEANLTRATLERIRQDRLRHTESYLQRDWQNAVSSEQRQQATVDGDRKARDADQAYVRVLEANLQNSRAMLAGQQAALDLARVDLRYTRILAPDDGTVTTRLARLGEYVAPGRALITLVPLRHVWAVANYREVQMTHVRPGQAAIVTVDALPGVRLRGHVDSLQPASQALGSALPPDRSTGTFTKVIQRIPVKVVLDPVPDLIGRLRPGLSAEVSIYTGIPP